MTKSTSALPVPRFFCLDLRSWDDHSLSEPTRILRHPLPFPRKSESQIRVIYSTGEDSEFDASSTTSRNETQGRFCRFICGLRRLR